MSATSANYCEPVSEAAFPYGVTCPECDALLLPGDLVWWVPTERATVEVPIALQAEAMANGCEDETYVGHCAACAATRDT